MNKHRSIWTVVGLALVLIAGLAARQQDRPRIGLVNLGIIMEQTPGFAEARSTFETEVQQYQSELQARQDSLQTKIQEFDQQSVVLTPTARSERQQELQQLQQQLQRRAQQLQTQSAQRERELLEPLENRVQAVIDGLRAERNLAIIFDVGAQGAGIVSADETLNLTPLVIQRLQAEGQ